MTPATYGDIDLTIRTYFVEGSNYWAIDKYEKIIIPHVEAANNFTASSAATSTGKDGDLVIVWTIEQPLNMADTWF